MAETDFAALSATVNVFAALGVLWLMQVTTCEAGFGSIPAVLKLAHRASLAGLSLALFYGAAATIDSSAPPRFVDFVADVALLSAVAIAAARQAASAYPSRDVERGGSR